MAQLVAHLVRDQEVEGSSPFIQTRPAGRPVFLYICGMKQIIVLIPILFFICSCTSGISPGEHIALQDSWMLTSENTGKTYATKVPSTVAGALYDCGILPANILEGDNYSRIDTSLFSGAWVYKTRFKARRGLNYVLRFDGLNYYADIVLNGTVLASSDTCSGVFVTRRYEVSRLIRRNNTLEIRLKKARPGDLNIGFVDWNPAPPDASMGIVRDVFLECSGKIAISDVYIHPVVESTEAADIEIRATLANLTTKPVNGILEAELEGRIVSIPVTLDARETKEVRYTPEEFHIDNPRLWWSRDLGTPELYSINVKLMADGRLSDSCSKTFGIRKIESGLDENGHRAYWLNGRKLLVLGAGWTDDIFLRDTHESLEKQVKMVADMNLNCIRFENIWGKDSYIYDLCDRYGLLAMVGWSCFWEWESYCGIPHHPLYGCINDSERNTLAVKYFESQVKWLRNHPSVFVWLTGSDRIPNPELEKEYLRIYSELDDRPYVCAASGLASLAGPSGNKMVGPYEYVGPEYWYADHKIGSAYGFNTETSIGANMPQIQSLRKMIGETDLWPTGPDWDYHCTVAAEDMHSIRVIREVVKEQYGNPGSLEEFVSRAHAVDYEGTRAMFEAFRVNRSQTTGLIQWMLNSAWPSIYWQLYDYYGTPTAAYYGVKKGCEPLQIIYNYSDHKLYAVNGTLEDSGLDATVDIYNAESVKIASRKLHFKNIPSFGTVELMSLEDWKGSDIFVFTGIKDGADNFYAIPSRGNMHDWGRSNWYRTPISSYADMSFITQLPKACISLSQEGKTVTVTNNSDSLAFQVVLSGNTWYSDNFFSLPPRASKQILLGDESAVSCTVGL